MVHFKGTRSFILHTLKQEQTLALPVVVVVAVVAVVVVLLLLGIVLVMREVVVVMMNGNVFEALLIVLRGTRLS